MVDRVAVIGAGTMGNGIAHVFAQYGFKVTLVDVNPAQLEKAMATITKNIDRQISKGLITEENKNTTLGNLASSSSFDSAVSDAGLIIEAASENTELKLQIFKQADELAPPGVILATNTSSIS